MIYHWTAKDAAGRVKSGELESLSASVAKRQLQMQGLTDIEVADRELPRAAGAATTRHGSNVATIFKALGVLAWIGAGVSMVTGGAEGIVAAILIAANGLVLFTAGVVIALLSEAVELLRAIAAKR